MSEETNDSTFNPRDAFVWSGLESQRIRARKPVALLGQLLYDNGDSEPVSAYGPFGIEVTVKILSEEEK